SVVDQDVDAAEAVDGGVDHRLDLVVVAHVDAHGERGAAGALDLVDDGVDAAGEAVGAGLRLAGDDHRRALAGEAQHHGATDAAAGAGDDGDASVQRTFNAHAARIIGRGCQYPSITTLSRGAPSR